MRLHGLQNFQQKGFYFSEHDLSLQALNIDDSLIQVKIMQEAKKIRKIKSRYEYLNLEVTSLQNEISEFIDYTKTMKDSNNAKICEINLENVQKRRGQLLSIEQKLKISEYDVIEKIIKTREMSLKKDFEKVRHITFHAGNTIIDKVDEIKTYFTDIGDFGRAFNPEDLGSQEEMLTTYGQSMQKYYANLNDEMAYKIRSTILNITDEFQSHICTINDINFVCDLSDVNVSEKAKNIFF